MSNLIVGIEVGGGANAGRKKRRMLWRGIRRRLVRNLKKHLQQIERMDAREAARGEALEYDPDLFGKNAGSNEDRAVKRLLARCSECLDATA
jgi:hypothetical protein